MIKITIDSGKEVLLNPEEIFSITDSERNKFKKIKMNILRDDVYGDKQDIYIISLDEYENLKSNLNIDK